VVPNCMFQSSRIVKVEDVVKCTVAYHKIDFYIPNQLLIFILLISDGCTSPIKKKKKIRWLHFRFGAFILKILKSAKKPHF
jgi:hypothetical protein